jgi:hypothetical protein
MAKNVKNAGGLHVAVLPELNNKVLAKEKHDGLNAGKTTGLRLVHYVTCLLAANETAHVTDEVLAETLRAEFPQRASFQAMPTWRAYYNGSKHGLNTKGRHSIRYGEDGEPARRAAPAKAESNGKAEGKASKPVKAAAPAPAPKAKGGKGKAAVAAG